MTVRAVRAVLGDDYGTPLFWVESALTSIGESHTDIITVVRGVDSAAEYKTVTGQGFTPYHVMCSNDKRDRFGIKASDFVQSLNNSVIKQVSAQRDGPRLRVFWMDQGAKPAAAGRFLYSENIRDHFRLDSIQPEVEIGVA
jgi:hypothetical protein